MAEPGVLMEGIIRQIRQSTNSTLTVPDPAETTGQEKLSQSDKNKVQTPALNHDDIARPGTAPEYSIINSQRHSVPIASAYAPNPCSIPTFNGNGKWRPFIQQFESIAQNLLWSSAEMLHYMLISLQGDAANFAFELPAPMLFNYTALVRELRLRFAERTAREVSLNLFCTRKLQSNETPQEYAAALKTLIQKAYPRGLVLETQEDMLLKQFFNGLDDHEACYRIRYLQRPSCLEEAVNKLQEYYKLK